MVVCTPKGIDHWLSWLQLYGLVYPVFRQSGESGILHHCLVTLPDAVQSLIGSIHAEECFEDVFLHIRAGMILCGEERLQVRVLVL